VRDFETAPRQNVDLRHTPVKGPATAPLQVVEYSDFLCPYCKSVAAAFNEYVPQAGDRLAIYFKQYPLDRECNSTVQSQGHPGSCWLALGGICAQEQGKFWAYHDKVFGSQLQNPKGHEVVKLAVEAGLDQAALETCMTSDRAKQRLAADIAEGRRVGVSGTPTILINGKRLPRLNDFFDALEREARRMGVPPLPRPKAP
jgi:protein-disulfide isomerase